jgi:hypothetical protein
MKKYKFEQFNIEIINPEVIVDLNTIRDKALDKLLSVDVLLKTETTTFGVSAEDMSYTDNWYDSDIQNMVNEWLINYEVE